MLIYIFRYLENKRYTEIANRHLNFDLIPVMAAALKNYMDAAETVKLEFKALIYKVFQKNMAFFVILGIAVLTLPCILTY